MIAIQGAMPDICKRCKERGGLEDGLYRVHTEEDYVDFYCDGQSPKSCPIKGEIHDKHGRLIEENKAYDSIAEETTDHYIDMDAVGKGLDCTPTVLEATE